MEYKEFRYKTNSLITAGELLNSLQRGEDKTNWIHSFLVKNYELSNGREGDIMCLALELQLYIAALRLDEYNTMSDPDEVRESLRVSLENFNGEEDLEKLKAQANNNPIYEKMIIEREQNLRALEALKEKYLGREMGSR